MCCLHGRVAYHVQVRMCVSSVCQHCVRHSVIASLVPCAGPCPGLALALGHCDRLTAAVAVNSGCCFAACFMYACSD